MVFLEKNPRWYQLMLPKIDTKSPCKIQSSTDKCKFYLRIRWNHIASLWSWYLIRTQSIKVNTIIIQCGITFDKHIFLKRTEVSFCRSRTRVIRLTLKKISIVFGKFSRIKVNLRSLFLKARIKKIYSLESTK